MSAVRAGTWAVTTVGVCEAFIIQMEDFLTPLVTFMKQEPKGSKIHYVSCFISLGMNHITAILRYVTLVKSVKAN